MVLELTTLERVRYLVEEHGGYDSGASGNTRNDPILENLIASVSLSIERYLNRPLLVAARTEYLDVVPDRWSYQLPAFPVVSVASVKNSATFDWTVDAKVEGTDFVLDTETGILRQLTSWVNGAEALQVVYTAGLAADTATILSAFPDLADACAKQVTEEFRRRDGLSRTTVAVQGSSTTSAAVSLLPVVRERLAPYRRPVW